MKIKSLKSKIKKLTKELNESEKLVNQIEKESLLKISPKQREFFNKVYPTFPDIDIDDIKRADSLIQRTIVSNKQSEQQILNLLDKNLSEFLELYPKAKKWIVDFHKEATVFMERKKQEVKENQLRNKEQKDIDWLNKQKKIAKSKQDGFDQFSNKKEAIDFYKDSRDLFDCGQGFFENKVTTYCFILDVFFEVVINAEILSAKQDVGDRLYWVENIEDVQLNLYDFHTYKKEVKKHKIELIKQKEKELDKLKNSL